MQRRNDRIFTLQWHLTDGCDMRCSHCYIPLAMKNNKLRKSFTLDECIEILNKFEEFINYAGVRGRINFSGGNPLIYPYFFDLAKKTKEKGILIGILGNPTSIMEDDTFEKIKSLGLFRYQISIDGMKEVHESFRGPGSFNVAISALERLIENRIPTVVLSTVSRRNIEDLPNVAELCLKKGVVVYDFARLVPEGEGKSLIYELPTPLEYKRFLYNMFNTYRKLKDEGYSINIRFKDPLWIPLLDEMGLLKPKKEDGLIHTGCSVGISHLTLDVDGTVYSCRRLAIPLGNIKNTNFQKLFFESELMKEHRNYERIDGCGKCDLLPFCRGCRAVSYSYYNSYFAKDPQCWRIEK